MELFWSDADWMAHQIKTVMFGTVDDSRLQMDQVIKTGVDVYLLSWQSKIESVTAELATRVKVKRKRKKLIA